MENSKKYKLNREDFGKIGKGLLIALGGAFCTFVVGLIPQIDFGTYSPLAVAFFSFVINAFRKFLKGV